MVSCYCYKYGYWYYCSPGNFGIVIWRPAGQRHYMTVEENNPSLYSECDDQLQELRGINLSSGIFFFTLKQTKLPTRLPQNNVQCYLWILTVLNVCFCFFFFFLNQITVEMALIQFETHNNSCKNIYNDDHINKMEWDFFSTSYFHSLDQVEKIYLCCFTFF